MDQIGAPYLRFAIHFDSFLKKKKLTIPALHKDISEEWKRRKQRPPSQQIFYMARWGIRLLPLEIILFLKDRYSFEIGFDDCFSMMNTGGVRTKTNGVRIPRQKDWLE